MPDSRLDPHGDRLDSWKEIAAYLDRDVRTVLTPSNRIVSYILFKVPLDTTSPAFKIRVSDAPGRGEGTPDPDAIGVLGCAPVTCEK